MLSCPGSSVGRALYVVYRVSWVRAPPRAANFSLKNVLSWVLLNYMVHNTPRGSRVEKVKQQRGAAECDIGSFKSLTCFFTSLRSGT